MANVNTGFSYRKLKSGDIRLCRIASFSTKTDVELHLEMIHVPHKQVMKNTSPNGEDPRFVNKYTALSYTWGSGAVRIPIHVNGQVIEVGENLHAFLDQIRLLQERDTWFWIDQLCINQMDTAERNIQVARMAEIYSYASSVYVWLGQEADGSDGALRMMQSYQRAFYHPEGLSDTEDIYNQPDLCDELEEEFVGQHEAGVQALRALFRRPYWERVWIVQELALAGETHLLCGSSRFSPTSSSQYDTNRWKSALHFLYYLVSQRSEGGTLDRVDSLLDHIDPNSVPGPISLLTLEFLHLGKCSDPRDHIYGTQALLHPRYRIKVDYSSTTEHVFWQALESMCRSPEAIAISPNPSLHEARYQYRAAPYWLLRKTMGLQEVVSDREIVQKVEQWVAQFHDVTEDVRSNELHRRALSVLLMGNGSDIEHVVRNVAGGMLNDGHVEDSGAFQKEQREVCQKLGAYFEAYPQKWPTA